MREQNEFTTEQEYKEYITKTVIDNSESTENIVTAGTEWDITNSEKDKEKNTFRYKLVNKKTGSILEGFTKEAISYLQNKYLNEWTDIYECLYRIKEKLAKNESIYSNDLNEKTIEYLYNYEDLFPVERFGEDKSEENYWFIQVIIEGSGKMDQKQLKRYKALLDMEILPKIKSLPINIT